MRGETLLMTKRKKFLPEKTVCENIPAEMAATAEEDILPAEENRYTM